MKKLFAIAFTLVLLGGACVPAFAAVAPKPGSGIGSPGVDYVPGEILVKYEEAVTPAESESVRRAAGESAVAVPDAAGIQKVKISEPDIGKEIEKLRSSPLVKYAEPNYIRRASWIPDDHRFDDQWNLRKAPEDGGIDMPGAWNIERGGSSSVIVAIIDTGVAYENYGSYHQAPDLADTHFVQGRDYVNGDDHPDDDNGHGTHVCGTVAENTNNGLDCAGIAFNSSIMPVKVLNQQGYGTDADLISGLHYAADHGADVINMSLGGQATDRALEDAVNYAADRGVVICAASGNDGRSSVDYPAAYPACIAVGATSSDAARWSDSNYGSALDVVAPGVGILQETFRNHPPSLNRFAVKSYTGTSMATPHVSGIAALVKSYHPSWSAGDVRNAIVSTARDLWSSGWDQYTGSGLVDGARALSAPRLNTPIVSAVTPGHGKAGTPTNGVMIEGESFKSPMDVMLQRQGEETIPATAVKVKSEGKLTCDFNLSGVQPGLWNVKVQNSALKSDTLEGAFMIDPQNDHTWYLAEGSTNWGYEEFILIQNPNSTAATAQVTLMTSTGSENPFPVSVPADSRVTVNVNSVLPGKDVSARVDSDQDIICERSMYWNNRIEGTDTIGVEAPSYAWYLAEGTTGYGFDTYLLIMNPDNSDAKVNVTYMTDAGPVEKPEFTVPARARFTIDVKGDLPGRDSSFKVVSDRRVIAERSMYWDGKRGGHCSIGTTSPAEEWYLAEGSTDWGFDEYVLLQNPGTAAADIDLTFMTAQGPVPQPTIVLEAGSRKTVHVNEVFPGKDLSVKVHADAGIVAERAMYWNNGTGKAGHDAIGVTQPREQCFLAEGSTNWGFDEWVLVQNPNDSAANITVEYRTSEGLKTRPGFTMAPNSRNTVHVNADLPATDTSTYIHADAPILAERSMYWNNKGGGHVSTGLLK